MVQTINIRVFICRFFILKSGYIIPDLATSNIVIFNNYLIAAQITKTLNLRLFKGWYGFI